MNFIDVQDLNTARNKRAVRAHAARRGYEARRAKQTAELVPKPKTVLPVHVESTQPDPSTPEPPHTWAEEYRPVDIQYGRIDERHSRPIEQRTFYHTQSEHIGPPWDRSEHHLLPTSDPSGSLRHQYVRPQRLYSYKSGQFSQPAVQHQKRVNEEVVKHGGNKTTRGARRRHEYDITGADGYVANSPV